ncbi:hypothetical protein Tco_0066579 [Tanacetum coccineum]
MVGRGFLYTMGSILNTPERLFSTFDGVCHQTFKAARFDVLRIAESDSDDEEEYVIKRNKFGAPIYGPKPTLYLNYDREIDDMLRIRFREAGSDEEIFTSSKKIIKFKLGGRAHNLTLLEFARRLGLYQAVELEEEGFNVYFEGGYSREAKSRYNTKLAQLLPRHIYSPCVVNWDVLNRMGCDGEIDDMLRIRLREVGSDEEIFTSVAWIRAFNINEPIYAELFHEFYSTYEFDEVYADDELQSKKIIKFRLGGRAHNLTLLEFARRLGLYQAINLEEEGFNVYFEGGLRNDDNFNPQNYWLSISREDNLGLSMSHTSTIRNPILRVIHKMITYGLCQRTTRYDKIQKNDLWLLNMFDARHQNGVLTDDVIRSLSALIYCRDLDTLIDSEGKLIPEYPQPGRMEIRQDEIERMEYRQSYHWDMYHGVFEHMA